ncbi:putative hemolysin [Pseudomonas sp. CGJS7]|uniref:putative hemolysin n=1 Tax=Pseudomonas sp. CGJS7 TaxID=3109348 RepID=UPI00300A51C1
MNYRALCSVLALSLLALTACTTPSAPAADEPAAADKPVAKVGMANPASVNCQKLGGKLEIRTGKDGGQYGLCALPDGRVCEEWALFRDGKCEKPAE